MITLRQAFTETTACFLAGDAVTWISDPGVGKTEKVADLKRWMRKTFAGARLGYACTFMATQNPTGLTGLPWKGVLNYKGKDYTITDPAIPQWFIAQDLETGEYAPADQFDKVLLVLEEWGQGDPETKRAGADLLRAGSVGKFSLPKGSFRLALSNRDSRDGVTKEYDFVIGRRNEFHIQGDADILVEDFLDKPQDDGVRVWQAMPVTKTFTLRNPTIVFEPKPQKQGPWCNPRSLTMWDRYAQVRMEMNGGTLPLDDPSFIEGTHGRVGAAAGTALLSTCQFVIELPPMERVIQDPTGCEVPNRPDLVMLMVYELAARVKPDDLASVLQYVGRFPQHDMHLAFVTALIRRSYKTFINLPPMQAWLAKNKQFVSMIGTMAA